MIAHMVSLAAATTTTATEASPSQSPFQQHPFLTLVPFLVFMVVIYYLLMAAPQKKQQQERDKMIATLRKGDKVVTIGGIHGKAVRTNPDDKVVTVQVAKGVEIDFTLAAISSYTREGEGE
jgi:preprotein translocase subunit YajC